MVLNLCLGGSVDESAKINSAAGIIRSAHLRGLHLLEIRGVTFDENASQPPNEKGSFKGERLVSARQEKGAFHSLLQNWLFLLRLPNFWTIVIRPF